MVSVYKIDQQPATSSAAKTLCRASHPSGLYLSHLPALRPPHGPRPDQSKGFGSGVLPVGPLDPLVAAPQASESFEASLTLVGRLGVLQPSFRGPHGRYKGLRSLKNLRL